MTSHWPTANRLNELRAKGIVPYSKSASGFLAFFAFVASLLLLRGQWESLWEAYNRYSILQTQTHALDHSLELIGILIKLIITPPLVTLVVLLAAGSLQTRFLVRLEALGLDFNRLAPFHNFKIIRILREPVWHLFLLLLGFLVALIAGYLLVPEVLAVLNADKLFFLSWFGIELKQLAPACILVSLVSAILAWLTTRFMFMMRHRMTQAEIEAEGGE